MYSVFLRFPEGKAKAVTFSYDDGSPFDKRLADIFSKNGLKGTFNFTCECARTDGDFFTSEEIKEIFLSRGHEIAIHGEWHRSAGNISILDGIREVLNCRIELERKCGRIIRGMAYPGTGISKFNNFESYEKIKNYLTELGIAYARTLAGDNNRFELPRDFHAWMPSAHHANPLLSSYIDEFLSLDISKQFPAKRFSRLLYIWGHSHEFNNAGNWNMIEEYCERLGGHKEIWYATNIEIYDYVEAYNRLIFGAEGKMVYNPSLIPVWFVLDNDLYKVEPGETVNIIYGM